MAGEGNSAPFGDPSTSAGDVNHDGYDDIVVNAPSNSSQTGKVHVYLGNRNGLGTTPAWTVIVPNEAIQTVAGAGDLNGDGYSDIVIGAPYHNLGNGKVYVFFGSPNASINPVPNTGGWNNTDVSITWNWADTGGSGIDLTQCTTHNTFSGEASAVIFYASCYDLAGNKGTNSITLKIDKTPPIFGECPASRDYALNSGIHSFGPISVDAGMSGMASGTLIGSFDTSRLGMKQVTFSASDNAGNSASKVCSYLVKQMIYMPFIDRN